MKDSLCSTLQSLNNLTEMKHPYVNFLSLFYFSRILYDQKATFEMIKKIRENRRFENSCFIKEIDIFSSNEDSPIILVIGNEKDTFHTILHAYGDTEKYTGWSHNELINKDLSILLPACLHQKHRQFLSNDTLFDGLLELNSTRRLYCIDRNGEMSPIDAILNLSTLNNTGLVFTGIVIFDQVLSNDQGLVLVDKFGNLMEGNHSANELLDLPGEAFKLSPTLGSLFHVMSGFMDEMLNFADFNLLTFDDIVSKSHNMKFWKVYYKWRKGYILDINTKRKKKVQVEIVLEDIRFGQGQHKSFIWLLKIISRTDGLSYATRMRYLESNPFFQKLHKLFQFSQSTSKKENSFEINSISACRLDETGDIQNGTMITSSMVLSDFKKERKAIVQPSFVGLNDNSNKLGEDLKFLSPLNEKHKASMDSKSRENNMTILKNNILRIPKETTITTFRRAIVNKLINIVSRSKRQIEDIKEENGDSDDSCNKNRSVSIKEIIPKHKRRKGKQYTQTTEASSKYSFYKILDRYKKEINAVKKFEKGNFAYIYWRALTAITVLLAFPMAISTLLTEERYLLIHDEILIQSSTLHYFVGTVMASQFPVIGMETCRLLKEGVYNTTHLKKYGVEDGYTHCDHYFKLGATSLNFYQNIYSRINMLLYPDLVNPEVLICDPFEYTVYSKDKFGNTQFEKLMLNLREALTLNSGFTRYFVERDYKNDAIIPIHSTQTKDRSSDPDEQMFRDNLAGRLNEHIDEKLHMFSDYLLLIALLNEEALFVDFKIKAISVALYIAIFIGIVVIVTVRIARKYDDILFIKDNVLRWKLSVLEQLTKNMRDIFAEKYISEVSILSLANESYSAEEFIKNNNKKNGKSNFLSNMTTTMPKRNGFKFNFDKMSYISLLLLILIFFYGTLRYLYRVKLAETSTNAIKIMVNSVDSVNHYMNMNGAAIQIILWNNTAHVWGRDALAVFKEDIYPAVEEKVLGKFEQSLNYSLGDFTDEYKKYMLSENPCGNIILKNNSELCQVLYDGILNQGFFKILKEFSVLCRNLVNRWEISSKTWSESEESMRSSYVLSTITMYPQIMIDFFNWMYDGVGKTLYSVHLLEESGPIWFTLTADLLINAALSITLGTLVYYKMKRIIKNSFGIFGLLQIDVLGENRVLMNRIGF